MISIPDLPYLLDRYERTGPRYTSYPPMRNVCMALDAYSHPVDVPVYSRTL